MKRPQTHYAKSGDINIAYQVIGQGPIDLVVAPGWISNIDIHWDMPGYETWIGRLTSFCRVIVFDKRGSGLSDRDVGDSALEDRADDLRAVMDAADSKQAVVLGFCEGGSLAKLFAAREPERVLALILFGTFPSTREAVDFPEGKAIAEGMNYLVRSVKEAWGKGESLNLILPARAKIPAAREFMGRFERASLSPQAALRHLEWIAEIDTREVARRLQVPTIVMHRRDDKLVSVTSGRWLANHIPGARLMELPGDEHAPWSGDLGYIDALEEFLLGTRHEGNFNRVLATVLFTDIVNSTEHAAKLGDHAWHRLLAKHHERVREQLQRHRGTEQDTAGDGFFVTFDGPARAVSCAKHICQSVSELGLQVRAGLHTGECERTAEKVGGLTVYAGARVMSKAEPGEILVSRTVKDLTAGAGLHFVDRGIHSLKGLPGKWDLFAVT